MLNTAPLLGHRDVLTALQSDIDSDNVAHAYLFAGPAHVGKFTVAKWFAQELLAVGVSEADRERVRHEVERLIHPDLLVVDQLWIEDACEDMDVIAQSSNIPQEHRKKAKAKTDTISIDDVRAVQERLHEVVSGRYRCCLIRSVERMQDEAVNALLKILEEPPAGVVFILTTSSVGSVLPTLLSRARVVRFSRVPEAELSVVLKDVDEEERRFLLHLSQGAPGTLLKLRDDPEALRNAKILHGAASRFWRSSSLLERLELLKPIHERGRESDEFLLHLALSLREQSPGFVAKSGATFQELVAGLETNVSRQLLAQRFAMSV